ncbi:MAG: hypothetical protein WBK95_10395 [Sulfurimonas sp.]|nr:hypothetical protein [Sulfurimonas sp.]
MMFHKPVLLPQNWLQLVEEYDVTQIANWTSQSIAKNVKQFILDKKESIIGARFVQVFLDSVVKGKFDVFSDFIDIPKFIIDEAFSEIKGEVGLRFCEKFDSLINEILAFQEVLKKEGFKPIQKSRANGKSDFFIKKYCLEYEAEVKFKMADQSFHDSVTHLIMGHSMFLNAHCLVGKKVKVNIKLPANQINDSNKKRVYSKVEQWCKSQLCNFSDADLDITIENDTEGSLNIDCVDSVRMGTVPEICDAHIILKTHMEKIQFQFKKRNPKRSIGIIIWATPWNYDSEKIKTIEQNIKDGIQCGLDSMGYVCDKLYIYPTKLKKPILFKQKNIIKD